MRPFTPPVIASDEPYGGAPLLRTVVRLERGHGEVAKATLRVTALGVFEAWIDGRRVSDDVLAPGWSSYEWRIRVLQYDVTRQIGATSSAATSRGEASSHALGIALGKGWWSGHLGWTGRGNWYGPEPAAAAELVVEFEDGHEQTVVTDQSWRSGPSATTRNDLYDGQDIDARLDDPGWSAPGFDDRTWTGVHDVDIDPARFVPYTGPRVHRQQEIAPVSVTRSPAGRTIVDFGQNLVGWVRVRATGPAGTVLTLRHAEVLEHGELAVRPLRGAKATDRFTFSGTADVFEPSFTFHGFRYVEIDGWPGDRRVPSTDTAPINMPLAGALTAVVVHSDLRRTGTFECSDPTLNRFHENIVWGQRGNFLDVPTDCPQRDERLGWTGDIAAFAPTAAFLFDSAGFLGEWLRDLRAEEAHVDHVVPFVVPDVLKLMPDDADVPPDDEPPRPGPTAIWSDAAAWVPWALWRATGDLGALREQYPAMADHVRRIRPALSADGLWDTGFQFGDWLDPDAPADDPIRAKADAGVVATASAFRSASIAAEAAALTGHEAEATEFQEMARGLQSAFRSAYVTEAPFRVRSDAPTVYTLAIVFGLLTEPEEQEAGDRLASLVRTSGHLISTGFAGTPFITEALTRTGHLDDAYELLMQRECPSWLYPVTMGATTVWERWDSMLPDGTINPGEMTSFNHYALGAVGDWIHRTVGGIAPATPGYDEVLIAPRPGGGITWATTAFESRHGRIAVAWEIVDRALHVRVEVPEGVTAIVRLDGEAEQRLGRGVHRLVAAGAGAAGAGAAAAGFRAVT
jgi:alpha-L-rhamnosidase